MSAKGFNMAPFTSVSSKMPGVKPALKDKRLWIFQLYFPVTIK